MTKFNRLEKSTIFKKIGEEGTSFKKIGGPDCSFKKIENPECTFRKQEQNEDNYSFKPTGEYSPFKKYNSKSKNKKTF